MPQRPNDPRPPCRCGHGDEPCICGKQRPAFTLPEWWHDRQKGAAWDLWLGQRPVAWRHSDGAVYLYKAEHPDTLRVIAAWAESKGEKR